MKDTLLQYLTLFAISMFYFGGIDNSVVGLTENASFSTYIRKDRFVTDC